MKYDKSCFLITAYCDNSEKVSVMSDCINNLREITNNEMDIFIHSHHSVDIDIQNKVKSVIFDKSNPVLKYPTKGYNFWRKYKNYTMSVVTDDYGYAVLSQWKNGMNYLNNLGYKTFFLINYDVFIDKIMFEKSYEYSINNDGVIYYWSDEMINAAYNIFTSKTIDLINNITLEDYLKIMSDLFEIYIKRQVVNNPNYSFKHVYHKEYKDNFYSAMDINSTKRYIDRDLPVSVITDPYVFFNHPYPESIEDNSKLVCQYHIASKMLNGSDENILTFLFFSVRKEMTLKIQIDDIVVYNDLIDVDFYLESDYRYSDFKDGKIDVKIYVDNDEIDSRYINLLKQNCRITT